MKRPPSGDLLQEFGSPGRTRTTDQVINSHPLYQLSYRGIDCSRSAAGAELSLPRADKSSGSGDSGQCFLYASNSGFQCVQAAGERKSYIARSTECRPRDHGDLRLLEQELGQGYIA